MERSRTSSNATSSSGSMSSGLLVPRDGASISSFHVADNQSQELAEQITAIRLGEDVPPPSTEGGSTDSFGGVNVSRGSSHSRTPSLSLTPPPADGSDTYDSLHPERQRGDPASRAPNSIDGRLGMSAVSAAIDGIAGGSDNPSVLLHVESPAAHNNSAHRRGSRRRSSSHTSIAPHNVMDEDPPSDPFHGPTFQQAFSDSKRFMSELGAALSSSSLHSDPDSTMRHLHEDTVKLAQFLCPSTRIVGFVGDSGVGKSSLLNSLLDYQGLARTSNSGAACTCVVTEYYYHDSNDFTIEVERFSIDEIDAQLTELLESYRHYHLHSSDMDQQEGKDFEERADIAQNTFRAMFKGRLQDERFLLHSSEETVIGTLRSWAGELGPASGGDREVQHSLEDCSTRLMMLTSEQNSTQGPAKWPYIRKIKVFLKAHILSKGLVLVDLPGLRDLNSARRSITERYLLKCDEIFAVCQIGRAMTDAGVMSVFELARRAELSSVGILCTKSDDIQAEEAKRDWHGQKATTIQRLIDAVATDARDETGIQAAINAYGDDDDDLSEEELKEHHALTQRLKQVTARKKEHTFELKQYLISTRNANVIETLNSLYREKVPTNDLKVFCVSNKDYWEHRNSPKDAALPFLQLSGIFTVRKHCISMVANSQLRIATNYIRNDIPALLGDIKLWVESGAGTVNAEQKEKVRETLNTVEARLKRELTGNSSRTGTISRSFKDVFRVQISRRQHIENWTRAATNASGEWSGWSHGSYAAFCRNFGNHTTEKVGTHNWNEEAIEQMTRELTTPWQELRSAIKSNIESYYIFIEELMDWVIDYLETEIQDFSDSASTLVQAMTSRQHLLVADVEHACQKFESGLSMLKTDALSGIRTSFIGKLMEGSYRQCNLDSNAKGGSGVDKRRKAIISGRLSEETLFENLQASFRNGFKTLVESLGSDIQAAITTHLSVIINTLNIVRNENVALESERDPEFRSRVERGVRSAMDEIRRIQDVISS